MPAPYKNVLLATDLHDDHEVVVATAMDMVQRYSSDLHVVHVFEFTPFMAPTSGLRLRERMSAMLTELEEDSKNKLASLGERLGVDDDQLHSVSGNPVTEILKLQEKLEVDLTVLGTHGQTGLKSLLGSTASGVLHGSKVDVLTIRVN